ncbi:MULTISPECIES: hypothetical protein [Reichenbachiella]|uniref:Uncharacterized protein n=1 Tax=Reichenbachiella agariperforans TaxID=156994 RepID=A0A1M6NX13_REIAG|nr:MULTISPECIES: hypothetical protein [Reichenbachiella]MBU2916073.1 hypothetical protein [Reichenbachiella agariperforans]RJE71685.1 hypothetical protein BGP76_06245 [Reichenbachiella sp. MSK19-1]SHK00202.1 hypothetical protein SAMN04488028_102448 [Reichenbachiella agariperforans]
MALVKFMNLSLEDKIQHLYENASFVTDIRYYQYKINLFLLEGVYYEVFVFHKDVQIKKITPLNYQSSTIGFYLDQIKLPQWV